MVEEKLLLRALRGETLSVPPIWMMRQAGRYLPEYRETRKKAGDFLSLCYNSELAAEVTLQPIRRFGFDAAIVFADILLVPQALGSDLWFVSGEGPRLSQFSSEAHFIRMTNTEDIHATLAPVYQTIRLVRKELNAKVALIGFAGAPWTVATYMIAGRGTPDQAPAHKFIAENEPLFGQLITRLSHATIEYLSMQIKAGADCVKIFDSWAGSLPAEYFEKYAVEPCREISQTIKQRFPQIPVIVFPRSAGNRYIGFAKKTGADCVALDETLSLAWCAEKIQVDGCVQGNLAPKHMVTGGQALFDETRDIIDQFSGGPHIFNLGHGITPDAKIDNVHAMIETVRGSKSV
ncbi:MAG: uroporphyrinogen decarboxylase [Aestuariivita sp.]|nr:uroporphyrinogen decarboxylase [Aestuariivita sp.]MCY4347947.1 uroporphyrinogen decarboxylase [Aestuariivita sp.]